MDRKYRDLSNLRKVLHQIHNRHKNHKSGKLASYIPELANVNPKHFGISITTIHGEEIHVGDYQTDFTIQSISKPFVFGLAIETHGMKHVRTRVGVEPTGEPFHSMIRLQEKSKRPSNPMVNTGAIAMTNLVRGKSLQEGQKLISKMFENYCGEKLKIDQDVFQSEKNTGHRNRAMAHLMLQFGMVDSKIEETMDLYFKQCSYNVTAKNLSVMGATLANQGLNPLTQKRALQEKNVKSLLTLMFTCGMYTYAGEWAFHVGLPAKSGVSGGILAVVPGMMGISVYSPLIDHHGNSVRGLKVFYDLARVLNFHVLH